MFSISDDGIKTRARKYLKPPRLVGDPGSRLSNHRKPQKSKKQKSTARVNARAETLDAHSHVLNQDFPLGNILVALPRPPLPAFSRRVGPFGRHASFSLFSFFRPLLFLPFGSSSSGFVFSSSCLKVSLKISPKSKRNFFLFSPPPRNRPRSRARFSDPRPRVPVLAFRGARVPSPNASFPERVRRREKRTSVAPLLVKGFPSFSLVLKRDESLDEEETDECPKNAGFGLRA